LTTWFVLPLVLLAGASAACTVGSYADENVAYTPARQQEGDGCDIAEPLRRLASDSTSDRREAREALLTFSSKSVEARQCVIDKLLRIARVSDGYVELQRFTEWREATGILGTLKATEALDTLIACLHCGDGTFGLSLDRFPATKALVGIGPEAVPKLAEALESDEPLRRYLAAAALSEIRGDEARAALQRVARKEQDEDTAAAMNYFLQNWDGHR
jgi:HEAT repeat protein